MGPDVTRQTAAILNAAWMVRHYARGARLSQDSVLAAQRRQAIHSLGLAVREAFSASDDFEPLLSAICDGLRPHDERPF